MFNFILITSFIRSRKLRDRNKLKSTVFYDVNRSKSGSRRYSLSSVKNTSVIDKKTKSRIKITKTPIKKS